jgi:hypothetical protein
MRGLHGQVLTDPFSNLLRIKNCCPKAKKTKEHDPIFRNFRKLKE